MPRPPQLWTRQELEADVAAATQIFVAARLQAMASEKQLYEKWIKTYSDPIADLLQATNNLTTITGDSLKDRGRLDAIRYTLSPIVSLDDLDTITDSCFKLWVKQTTNRGISPTDAQFKAAAAFLGARIDGARAPWLISGASPTSAEIDAFVRATASIRAMSKVQTERRMASSKAQEVATKAAIQAAGYTPDPKLPANLSNPANQMRPGTFAPNPRNIIATSSDVPVRLKDNHPTGQLFLAIEAKVSNSSINSRKRLNDVAAKSAVWDGSGGLHQSRTAAVIGGVYDIKRLEEAQNKGIFIFWEHRLQDLTAFLK